MLHRTLTDCIVKAAFDCTTGAEVHVYSAWLPSGIAGDLHPRALDGLTPIIGTRAQIAPVALYKVERSALQYSPTSPCSSCGPRNISRSESDYDSDKPSEGELRESILANDRARRLAEQVRCARGDLIDAERQIDELLRRHQDWCLVLVDRECNKPVHHAARRLHREDR